MRKGANRAPYVIADCLQVIGGTPGEGRGPAHVDQGRCDGRALWIGEGLIEERFNFGQRSHADEGEIHHAVAKGIRSCHRRCPALRD